MLNGMVNSKPRTCGFRFSITDGLAIIIATILTVIALPEIGSLAWVILFVLGHFFLFCNVFRIPPKPELIWAGTFLLNMTTFTFLPLNIFENFIFQLPITFFLIIKEVFKPTYHGIYSLKINKEIDKYLAGEI